MDFLTDPWGRHLVQIEGHSEALLVTFCEDVGAIPPCKDYPDPGRLGKIVLRGMRSLGISSGRIRTLGYIGSFLLEYGSAQEIIASPPPAGSAAEQLLRMVSSPPSDVVTSRLSTLSPGGQLCSLLLSELEEPAVPYNEAQAAAVKGLRPGLDVIHGPPGSGESINLPIDHFNAHPISVNTLLIFSEMKHKPSCIRHH